MRPNPLRTLFEQGHSAVNGWLHLPTSVSAEALAQVGFDSLTLDLQHGPIDYPTALVMLQAMSSSAVTPLCRVPWNEPGIIMKMLDAGCYGIICPMISSRAEAEAFVGACRYPPAGYRSFGPTRARLYAGSDYGQHANDTILTFAMIETRGALDNLDAIMSVPGLDAVYVGPADLSQALGGPPGSDFEDGPVADALPRILDAANRHGIVAGIHTGSPAYARKMLSAGFRFVTVQSDLAFLAAHARSVVAAVRSEDIPPTDAPPAAAQGAEGPY